MSTEVIVYTQVGSLLAFIGVVFVLYRLLVKQKDATIEVLRERISFQDSRIAKEGPDVLAEGLSKRIKLLSEELVRLSEDKNPNAEKVEKKEKELTDAKEAYERLQKFALHATGMSVSYFCPRCNEPTLESIDCKLKFFPNGTELFRVAYVCGYVKANGEVESKCKSKRSEA